MNWKFKPLVAIISMFLLIALPGANETGPECNFSPYEYQAVAGFEINVTVALADPNSSVENLSVNCGNNIVRSIARGDLQADETHMLFNFSCTYNSSGEYHPAGTINTTDGEQIGCDNIAQVTVAEAPLPPSISSLAVENTTSTSAMIVWKTNQPSNSSVTYWITENSSIGSAQQVTAHSVKLSNLQEGKAYYYFATSCNLAGCARSETSSFTPANMCAVNNKCETAGTATSYRKFYRNENSGICEVQETVTCGAAEGCCEAGCSDASGCLTRPVSGRCAEICNDPTRKSLSISGTCNGCGQNYAKGTCSYAKMECTAESKCKSPSSDAVTCGGIKYYCVLEAGSYVWSPDSSPCIPAPSATHPPVPISGGGDSGGGGFATITATARPSVSPSVGQKKVVEIPLESDDTGLLDKVENETLIEILNAPDRDIFNRINVTRAEFDPPDLIRENGRVLIIGTTDSKYPLRIPKCYIPPEDRSTKRGSNGAECICSANYGSNFSRFRCEIAPKFPKMLAEKYTIELRNDMNESGLQTLILPIGKKASLVPLTVTKKRNEILFYAGTFIGMMLAAYALYHLLSKFEKEQKRNEVLHGQKRKILEDMDVLKFHYLKRDIDYSTFNMAMVQKQKELTEVDTRIAEFEAKAGIRKPAKPAVEGGQSGEGVKNPQGENKSNSSAPSSTNP